MNPLPPSIQCGAAAPGCDYQCGAAALGCGYDTPDASKRVIK